MTSSILPPIRDRLVHLTETLHHLKDRVGHMRQEGRCDLKLSLEPLFAH